MTCLKGIGCFPLAAGAAAVLTLVSAGVCTGTVHRLGEGSSIQAAIGNAAAGDTILLSAGVYDGNIIIDVPIVLRGTRGAEIRGGYTGNVVHITASGSALDGVHVKEAGASLTKDMACVLVEADSVTVQNCTVSRSLHGIYVKGGNRTHIRGNRIEGRLDLIEADRGNGIHLWNSRGNRVENNEILNVRDGIYFSFADSTVVLSNHIHNVRYGLHYMYSQFNVFVENVFEHNVAGAALMYSHNIAFHRNLFAHCRGFRAYGVLYQSMESTLAENNLILDNSRGIFLNNSSHNVLEGNDVVDNDLAIQLNGGCTDNLFVSNNFVNNLSDLILDVSDKETAWQGPARGNHWSAYGGYDLTGDGVGDIAHNIQRVFQIVETRVPEVRFYLFSPAAEILEEAEKALPILNLGSARDRLPLIRHSANGTVPWTQARARSHRSSPGAAAAYLVGSLVPIGLLLRWCGGGRGRRP